MKVGWLKLHRQLRDNPYMKKPAYRSVWIEILLEATHRDEKKTVIWKGKQIILNPGQLTFGMKQLASETGVPRGTVERIVKTLKSEEMIEVQTSSKFSLITVKNWEYYQKVEEKNEEQVRSDRGASEERVRTPKEEKKERSKTSEEKSSGGEKDLKKIQPHIQVINMLAIAKETKFEKKQEYNLYIRRNARIASELIKAYDIEIIAKAFCYCSAQNFPTWGLEAVAKNIQTAKNTEITNPKIQEAMKRLQTKSLSFKI